MLSHPGRSVLQLSTPVLLSAMREKSGEFPEISNWNRNQLGWERPRLDKREKSQWLLVLWYPLVVRRQSSVSV